MPLQARGQQELGKGRREGGAAAATAAAAAVTGEGGKKREGEESALPLAGSRRQREGGFRDQVPGIASNWTVVFLVASPPSLGRVGWNNEPRESLSRRFRFSQEPAYGTLFWDWLRRFDATELPRWLLSPRLTNHRSRSNPGRRPEVEGRSLLERGGAAPTSEPTMRTVFFETESIGEVGGVKSGMSHAGGEGGASGTCWGRRATGEKTRHGRAKPLVSGLESPPSSFV